MMLWLGGSTAATPHPLLSVRDKAVILSALAVYLTKLKTSPTKNAAAIVEVRDLQARLKAP